uniref:Uncharacterized protein n=1 Tax=Marinomonas sp. (strain MWYL1) TaxID=400668 RepID=A6VSV3_MARMS
MKPEKHILKYYSDIFKTLSDRHLSDGDHVGWMKLDSDNIKIIKVLSDSGLAKGVFSYSIDGVEQVGSLIPLENISDKHFNEKYLFKIKLVSVNIKTSAPIFKNWDELLEYPEYIKKPLDMVFFTDSAQFLSKGCGDLKFKNYQNTHKLYDLIKRLIDDSEGNENTIYYQRPLSFKFILQEEDLNNYIDVEAIEKLYDKDVHKEAMNHLICAQIVSRLKDIECSRRFGYLVQTYNLLVADVLIDYNSYAESYTFDKIRKEYLEKRTEYISGVHEIFDNISLKLLSLPAGLWFATSQISMDPLNTMDNPKNLVVLLTVAMLAILLIANISGQFANIRAIKFEYTDIFTSLSDQFKEEKDNIDKVKNKIDCAAFWVKCKLWLSIFIALALVGLTLWLFKEAGSITYAHKLILDIIDIIPCFK